jgi:hypothetical protein
MREQLAVMTAEILRDVLQSSGLQHYTFQRTPVTLRHQQINRNPHSKASEILLP